MDKYPRFSAFLNLILIITMLISLSACAEEPGGEDLSASPPEDGQAFEYHTPRLLGFVVDPASNPIAFAEVGGEDIATEDGVASGDFLDYQGGWIPVTALGYASSYAEDLTEELDFPFFVTYLTPYNSMQRVDDETPVTLSGFYQEEIYLSAEVSAGLFQDSSPMVGLAVMDRYSVSPLLAPYPDGEGLWLRNAFALEAFDEDWNPTQLKSGAAIPIIMEMPSALSDQAAFARFDMAAGEWQTIDLGCQKGEDNSYLCQLETLDPLIGIFDQPGTFAAGVAHSPRGGAVSLRTGNSPEEDYQNALNALTDWIDAHQNDPGGINPDHPELIKLIADLKKAALDHAKNNRNEDGKKKLIEAAGKAQMTGLEAVGSELNAEAAKISDELGKDALKESDCGEYRRLLKAAGQIQKTGGDLDLAQQLIDKVKEMAKDCDVWVGTIHVMLFVSPVHASGKPQVGWGPNTWHEFHQVKLSTNVQTHEMFGEDWVNLSFPEVTYGTYKPCLREIRTSGSGWENLITIEGRYDGYNFTVTLVSPQGAGGSVTQSWEVETQPEGVCETTTFNNFSFAPFHSFLTHGVSGEVPPLTYVDILDTTNLRTSAEFDTFRGDERISGLDPEMGIYPVETGSVSWSFIHTIKKLPLKDE